MKQLLRQRLMEHGWRDQMKAYCKGIQRKNDACANCRDQQHRRTNDRKIELTFSIGYDLCDDFTFVLIVHFILSFFSLVINILF